MTLQLIPLLLLVRIPLSIHVSRPKSLHPSRCPVMPVMPTILRCFHICPALPPLPLLRLPVIRAVLLYRLPNPGIPVLPVQMYLHRAVLVLA